MSPSPGHYAARWQIIRSGAAISADLIGYCTPPAMAGKKPRRDGGEILEEDNGASISASAEDFSDPGHKWPWLQAGRAAAAGND
jgi:hypothetical protein